MAESQKLAFSASLATGTSFVFLQADFFNQVVEADENNNVSVPIQISVTLRRPDLVPTAFIATSSTTIAPGGTIDVEWTVPNQPNQNHYGLDTTVPHDTVGVEKPPGPTRHSITLVFFNGRPVSVQK